MSNDEHGMRLRTRERRQLLGHLADLGAAEPERRADAALHASELLRRKGLTWQTIIPAASPGDDINGVVPTAKPKRDWRADVLALLDRPDIDPTDRAFLHKLAGWRAPGADGLARLRTITEKLPA